MSGDTRPFPFGVFVPPISTHTALVRFRGVTGNIIQGTQILVDDNDNITMPDGSKINGRNVFDDGVKLDGIEVGATADQTGEEIVALLEALAVGARLSHNYLDDVGADDHHDEDHSIASHNDTTATGAELETLTNDSLADALHRHSELSAPDGAPDRAVRVNATGGVGIGVDATAVVHLKAGTAAAGTGPLKFEPGTNLTTPEAGVIEYDGDHFTITNLASRKVIDRTSDVVVETVTVANTATETIVWTAPMAANSLQVGNVFKFHADGLVSNNGNNADNDFTLRVRLGSLTGGIVIDLTPNTKAMTDAHWHANANATQRTIGGSGSRAFHFHLSVDSTDEETEIGLATVNTEAIMDIVLTVQWATAHANNSFTMYQGFLEFKN